VRVRRLLADERRDQAGETSDLYFDDVVDGGAALLPGGEPIGRRRYWPIFEAVLKHGLSIGMHSGGTQAYAPSPGGFAQFYVEDHQLGTHSVQSQITSLILEGVFDVFPDLKIVMIEGGFGWVPQLGWRMDAHWTKMRSEVPTLKRYRYVYVNNQLVLVDPETSQVVDIITE